MSREAEVWVRRNCTYVDGTAYTVLCALAEYADEYGEHACPSVPTIARMTHASERTVQRALKELRSRNVIIDAGETGYRTRDYSITGMQNLDYDAPASEDPFFEVPEGDNLTPPTDCHPRQSVTRIDIDVVPIAQETQTTEVRVSRTQSVDEIYSVWRERFDPDGEKAPEHPSRATREKIRKATLEATPEECVRAIHGAYATYDGFCSLDFIFTNQMKSKAEGRTLGDRIHWLAGQAPTEVRTQTKRDTPYGRRIVAEEGSRLETVMRELRQYVKKKDPRYAEDIRKHFIELKAAGIAVRTDPEGKLLFLEEATVVQA